MSGGIVGNIVKIFTKTANESITNDDVLSDDGDLQFEADANKKYLILVFLKNKSPTNADFKYALSLPAGATGIKQGSAVQWNQNTLVASSDATSSRTLQTSNVNLSVPLYFIIEIGSTSGTVAFQWAQGTSNAGSTVLQEGSCMVVIET